MEPTVNTVTTAVPSPPVLEALPRREQVARRYRIAPDTAWALARFSLDATMLGAAALASSLGARAAGVDATPAPWLALFAVLVAATFAVRGSYRPRLRTQMLEDVRGVVAVTALAAMA